MEKVKVIEYFLTWQGEGRNAGRRAWFFRFPGCNLRCLWCDTKYSWSRYELVDVELPFVSDTKLVVITGGEPLADWNREEVVKLIDGLRGVEMIDIETNGVYPPLDIEDSRITYVVSPKPEYVKGKRIDGVVSSEWFKREVSGLVWKFVLGDDIDRNFIERFIVENKLDGDSVWIMPRGVSVEELLGNSGDVIEFAKRYGCNVSLRLHVLVDIAEKERRWRKSVGS